MERKVYTSEEIAKIAPRYKGKVENFDPNRKKGLKKTKSTSAAPSASRPSRGPSTPDVPVPTHVNTQTNGNLIVESIFGVDICVTAINPRQFACNYSKIIDISDEVYDRYVLDEKQLDRQLARPELGYYTTGLLWMKLIDVKAKLGRQALSTEEQEIREAGSEIDFNIPQPIHVYLAQIGNFSDKIGSEAKLEVPSLPMTSAGGKGGYHANAISETSHNLFEEVPSLGIAADMVMVLASDEATPIPNFGFTVPSGARVNENLVGYKYITTQRRPEIKSRLHNQGITSTRFPEFIAGTRFNLKYMMSISDIIGQFNTFRNDKVNIPKSTMAGGETQVIITRPQKGEDVDVSWRRTTVLPTSASRSSDAQMGAAYIFGFQLFKEDGEGDTLAARAKRWSCIEPEEQTTPWAMPEAWHANRNDRRNLPGIGNEDYRALGKRQDIMLQDVVRRMVRITPSQQGQP